MFKGFTLSRCLCAAILLIYVGSYLRLAFADIDPLMYAMIGHAFVSGGILPYGYVFDHKPMMLYAFYGIWSVIDPLKTGFFTFLALGCCGVFAWLARNIGVRDPGCLFVMLLLGGAPFGVLAGNAECVYLPVMLGTIIALARGAASARGQWFVLAGMLASLAANTNYLAGPALLFPICWALLSVRSAMLRCLALFGAGVLGALAVMAAPYLLGNVSLWGGYLHYQALYLSHYGAGRAERVHAWVRFGEFSLVFVPVVISWVRNRAKAVKKWDIVAFWAASSLMASFVSGHPFPHYFLLCLAPLCLMAALLRPITSPREWWLSVAPAVILAGVWIVHDTTHNVHLRRELAQIDYAGLEQRVGSVPVLSVEASHVPYYMANLRSAGRYIFPEHVTTIYGDSAASAYIDLIRLSPGFVMTGYDWCEGPSAMVSVCREIDSHYHAVMAVPGRFGFSLYERRPQS